MAHPTSSSIALQTSNLTVGYAEESKTVFKDLNLSLRVGELVCFMGPNGVGKSTLIRTLAGLQSPLSGSIKYRDTAALSKQIAVVLTDKITATDLTAYELIVFGRYPYLDWNLKLTKADEDMVNEIINQVNIGALISKRIDQLSDGQLQMVMIARALAQECEIILLDEPTAHLDLNNRVEIMNMLRHLSRVHNKAILMATHELDLALQAADLVWLAGNTSEIISGLPEDLVLNGAFDEVFRFKGFDLKTGKIQHAAYRDKLIALIGSGSEFLWTKNALERNGYEISDKASTQIEIELAPELCWILRSNNIPTKHNSLAELLSTIELP